MTAGKKTRRQAHNAHRRGIHNKRQAALARQHRKQWQVGFNKWLSKHPQYKFKPFKQYKFKPFKQWLAQHPKYKFKPFTQRSFAQWLRQQKKAALHQKRSHNTHQTKVIRHIKRRKDP